MATLKLPVKQSQETQKIVDVETPHLDSEPAAIPDGLVTRDELNAAEKKAYELGLVDGNEAASRKVSAEREEVEVLSDALKRQIATLDKSTSAISGLIDEFNQGLLDVNGSIKEIAKQFENDFARYFLFDEDLLAQQIARKVESFSREMSLVDYRIIADPTLKESFKMDESLAHHLPKIEVESGACKLVLIDSEGELYWDPGMIRDLLIKPAAPDSDSK
ncbi:hypothetical protein [Microbulbifer sp. ALW1]|uniref:hypothetical protein n=1 Tax=Microbulbifer sp. (strain ALW1) TaxID=1516059 RepID=UPI0013580FF8|nr:hypothetical protein [Microbulbifer sp. ALW1]